MYEPTSSDLMILKLPEGVSQNSSNAPDLLFILNLNLVCTLYFEEFIKSVFTTKIVLFWELGFLGNLEQDDNRIIIKDISIK